MPFSSITAGRNFTLQPVGQVPYGWLHLDVSFFFRAHLTNRGIAWRGGKVLGLLYAERPCDRGLWEKIGVAKMELPPYARSDIEKRHFPPFDQLPEAALDAQGRYMTGGTCGFRGDIALETLLWPGKYRVALVLARDFDREKDTLIYRDRTGAFRARGARPTIIEMPCIWSADRVDPLKTQAGVIVPIGQVETGKAGVHRRIDEVLDPILPSFRRHALRLGNTNLSRVRISAQKYNAGQASEQLIYWIQIAQERFQVRLDFGGLPMVALTPWHTFHQERQLGETQPLKVTPDQRNAIVTLRDAADAAPPEMSLYSPAYTDGLIATEGKPYETYLKSVKASVDLAKFALEQGRKTLDGDAVDEARSIGLKVAANTGVRNAAIRDPNNVWGRAAAALFLFEHASIEKNFLRKNPGRMLDLSIDLSVHTALQLRTWERVLATTEEGPFKTAADFAARTYFTKQLNNDLNTVLFHVGVLNLFSYEYEKMKEISGVS